MPRHRIHPALLWGFVAAECAIYVAFLTLDLTGHSGHTIVLKYAGILLCLAFALLAAFRGGDRLVAAALVFTAGADWFLLVLDSHPMLSVALFLCVQTLYLIRLRRWGCPQAMGLRMGLVLLGGLAAYRLNMATPLNLLALLYFAQLLSNTVMAWFARTWCFALGLTLFVGCDVCVGLSVAGLAPAAISDAVSFAIWMFYLPSQVLIVLSALPKKEAAHENQ